MVKPIFKWVAENRLNDSICTVSYDKCLKICKTLSQGCLIFLIQKRCILEIIFDNQLWFDLNATLTHYNCQLRICSWRLFWNYGCWYLFCKHLVIYHWILSKTYFQLEIRNPDPYRHTNRLHVYGLSLIHIWRCRRRG